MVKKIIETGLVFLSILLLVGCADHQSHPVSNKNNSVRDVISEQIKEKKIPEKKDTKEISLPKTLEETENENTDTADYDLTTMSSDLVYAFVYQLMADPETYVGKTIRMKGAYYASYYENTGRYYQFCIIKDAMACCSQGIEFIWDDGSHVYPDEYPEVNTEIVVKGTFETYHESDETAALYCRLKDASMERSDEMK